MKVIKDGHKYEDYLKFIEENDVSVWQMDCVEGTKEDAGAILTLHSPEFHLQLLFILKEHTSKCVVDMLDTLEFALGYDIYSHVFEVILTDNGHEFSDLAGMETSIAGGIRRSRVFYCEPNRSDQKGACEENHKMVRYVIPKGTSIDKYMQWDMTLLTNHLNSYPRRSLYGKCPYEVAMRYLPEDFFILIGLERIAAEKVLLQPSLLHHPQD